MAIVSTQGSINFIDPTAWRNKELERTDSLALLPDHPQAAQILAYRQALREWPSTEDYPDTRPVMGE